MWHGIDHVTFTLGHVTLSPKSRDRGLLTHLVLTLQHVVSKYGPTQSTVLGAIWCLPTSIKRTTSFGGQFKNIKHAPADIINSFIYLPPIRVDPDGHVRNRVGHVEIAASSSGQRFFEVLYFCLMFTGAHKAGRFKVFKHKSNMS